MRLSRFEFLEPTSLAQAASALAADPAGSVLLAGGTDLIVNMKQRLIAPKRVINLKSIPELSHVSRGRAGLRLGALATLDDIASSPVVREQYPAIADAAMQVGAYAHQVMGTVGGNLLQGNRCRYYNQSDWWRRARTPCYKAGGETCWVVRKPEECHSAYCGDMAPVLVALDSKAALVGPRGRRVVSLTSLYTQDGKTPLSLRRGEILEEVLVPPPAGEAIYLKVRLRDAIDFPVISLAVAIQKGRSGAVRKARVVFSGVGSGPVHAPAAERIITGTRLTDDVIDKAAKGVMKEVAPLRISVSSPAYKRKMSAVLLKQALETLRGGDA